MVVLLDSNIIIDFFANKKPAVEEISKYDNICVSIISYIEVMIGLSREERVLAQKFFNNTEICWLDQSIANETIHLRDKHRIKLPDALILATAVAKNLRLLTRDEASIFKNHPNVRYPYKI